MSTNRDLVYVVAGPMRHGTNMTMGAIKAASDLPVLYSESRAHAFEDMFDEGAVPYKFNAGGLLELELCQACRYERVVRAACSDHDHGAMPDCKEFVCITSFRRDPRPYCGYLVKIHVVPGSWNRESFPPGVEYRVIVLSRDYDEMVYSAAAGMGMDLRDRMSEVVFYQMVGKFWASIPTQDKQMVWMRHLAEPDRKLAEWTKLADAGWPIDPKVAADHCKWELVRHRVENGLDMEIPLVDVSSWAVADVNALARQIGLTQ